MENVWHMANPVQYPYFCINPVSPSIYAVNAISIYLEKIRVLPYINNEYFSWGQSLTRTSKLKTSKTEEKKKQTSELMCFVKLAAKQTVFPAPPLTVNHLISLQLLLLHILQYVTPLLTDTWWLLIKKAWEIKLKKRGSDEVACVIRYARCQFFTAPTIWQ